MKVTSKCGLMVLTPFLRSRRQLLCYKILAVTSTFSLISVLTLSYLFLDLKQLKLNPINKSNYRYFRPELINKSNHETISYEEQQLRKKILLENRDEFVEEVLKETSFFEIDLFSKTDSVQMPYLKIFDKSIQELEAKARVLEGLGETGMAGYVPDELKDEADRVFQKEAFNRILSEMISVNRSVFDTREVACRKIQYNVSTLPTLSVIIIFSNEALISIVRTIHSVINRTPENLLKEVILVDDFSDHLDLQGKLERYLATRFRPLHKIRLIKLSKRTGLIRARMLGAHVAVGDALVFLDAHCEVNVQWAEPLLERIKEDRKVILSPVIDNIHQNTMEYSHDDSGYFYVGGFTWSGLFHWIKIPNYEKERKKFIYSPTRTATIAGGLFAVDRKYFWEIGSYDPGMEIWGGENFEISLRVWQCGGSVEMIPCSRVGHIFRDFRPYEFPKENLNIKNEVGWNTARVAEVWMDEYKELYYLHSPEMKGLSFGNVTGRIEWRKRMNCNSFQWYLEKVYREKFRSKMDSQFYGQLRNPKSDMCLDNMQHEEPSTYKLELYPCHRELLPSQLWFLSKRDQLRRESVCATFPAEHENIGEVDEVEGLMNKTRRRTGPVIMKECDEENSWDTWEYQYQNGRVTHAETEGCLTVKMVGNRTLAVLEKCLAFGEESEGREQIDMDGVTDSADQKWEWLNYNKP